MIKITNLTLKNFLSVGAVTQALSLDQSGVTMILGTNTDSNGGLSRNGAGKTTILQAISYAIYGTPVSKIKQDNLINNINQKGMIVTIEFERDGTKYKIERGRKPNILRFFKNSEEITEENISQGENRHTQTQIEAVVGMSSTMFRHIVALNTYTDPFLKMKPADQREVIEELLGVTQISTRADKLKELLANTKDTIRTEEANHRATTEANARIQSAIDSATQQSALWEQNHNITLNTLAKAVADSMAINYEAEIAKFDEVDAVLASRQKITDAITAAEREVQHWAREVSAINAEIDRITATTAGGSGIVSRLNTEKTRKANEIDRKKTERNKFLAEHEKVTADRNSDDTKVCVCCNQKLDGTDHLQTVLANLDQQLSDISGNISRVDSEIEALEAEYKAIDDEITAAEAKAREDEATREQELAAANQKLIEPTAQLAVFAKALQDAQATELPSIPTTTFKSRDDVYKAKAQMEALARELQTEKDKVDPNLAQIAALQSTLQNIDTTALDDAVLLKKHQEFLFKLLTSKDSFIRKKIIDQNLSYLNARMDHYLQKLGLPHEVRFQSDLTVDIALLGRDYDFEQLSRGEMNRVIMATSWAFRDVWESLNSAFNLMFVDELLDQGTCSYGVEAALQTLKGIARNGKNVFLISHRDDLVARMDRTLLIRKENHFTVFDHSGAVV